MNIGDVICCVMLYFSILFVSFIFELLASKNDPVHNCKLYKEQGCSHVDGMLCDFPNCSMNNEYVKEKNNESKMC